MHIYISNMKQDSGQWNEFDSLRLNYGSGTSLSAVPDARAFSNVGGMSFCQNLEKY